MTLSKHAIRPNFLPFSPPYITEAEIEAVVATLRTDWITTGPQVRDFENDFIASLDAPENLTALALNSCTAGLHVALATLNIGPGDEVITSPMTFCSSVNVIEHVGATPVLADVEPDTLTLDPQRVAEAITPRTKAIIPVHYAGHPADMRPIMDLAREHGLYIIEDAAHSLPASYEGQRIGTIGDFTSFSFYATKNLTTGEGGMLTGSPEHIARARVLSLHGMSRDAWKRYSAEGSWFYEVIEPGFKYNMPDIQAAIGRVQLGRLNEMQSRRYEVVEQYHAAFADVPALQIPVERPNVEAAWHLYVLRLHPEHLSINRGQFIEELRARNIGTSVHFIPVHLHPYYRDKYGWKPDDFPVTFDAYQRILSLPLHPRLSDDDIADVTAAVLDIVAQFS
ncbi:MAG: DegT/DnrJ/EryC1/StrS family aminotransferase [Burkholderiales bacterium]|nr:DegT/DnrJ/EryC1/StrS family aminotransferase [Anaerolineae bacterium]